MEVVYLATALEDMQWVRRYYAEVFPEGRGHARAGLLKTEALIAENPFVGHVTGDDADVREFPVARTPFSRDAILTGTQRGVGLPCAASHTSRPSAPPRTHSELTTPWPTP